MKRNNLTSSVIVDIVIDYLVEIILKLFCYYCPIFSYISYYIIYTKHKLMLVYLSAELPFCTLYT